MTNNRFHTEVSGMLNNMLSFAMMLTSDEKAAYELTQDATLHAIENESDYTAGTSLKQWLYTIMRNIYVANRHKSRLSVGAYHCAYPVRLSAAVGLEAPEGSRRVEEVDARIACMPAAEAQVFTLYVQGYTCAEISERTGMAPRAVHWCVVAAGRSF